MNRFLLDVNVVLALLDTNHEHHLTAHAWAAADAGARWLTCPMVQNAVVRITGHRAYPSEIGPPPVVREVLRAFCDQSRHEFCPEDISLLDAAHLARPALLTSHNLTDVYLLALARHHGARLATFDRRIAAEAVPGGRDALELIGA